MNSSGHDHKPGHGAQISTGSTAVSSSVEQHDFAPGSELPKAPDSGLSSPSPSPAPIDTSVLSDSLHNTIQTPSVSSWSAASDRALGHGSHSDDRVFPIRSVISVDPTNRSSTDHEYFPRVSPESSAVSRPPHFRSDTDIPIRRHGGSATSDSQPSVSGIASPSPVEQRDTRRLRYITGAASSVQSNAERHGSKPLPLFANEASDDESEATGDARSASALEGSSGLQTPSLADSNLDGLMTTRFKHVTTEEGHHVITGRDGTLQRCEDEPIHTPGAVQGFGLMMAIREEVDGRFTVRYVSENSKRIIGYTPLQLFRLNNFTDILTEEQADNLLDHVDFVRDEDADPSINGPEVFSMSIRPPKKRTVKLWCAIHIHPAHPDLVICEFELDDDHDCPLRPDDERTPDVPQDTLHSNPTMEELAESTEISSKPLRVLRSARKRRGEAGAMQVFDIMSQVQDQLASATNLDQFLKILVGIVKELTGFHRVMVYQFDATFNGKVVTELVDPTHTRDLYKGLHFPASDIPRQARDLYKLNKVRLLYDRDQETARLVCRSKEDLDTPLDMTHSYLRAMSPIHLKYLGNMEVRSSMSISINAFNELWGLIACHSYGSKGMRVSFPIRKMCRLVGDTVSRNIERLSYASRLHARKLINTVPTDKNPSGYIIASSDDLLRLFDADFGMLSIKGETKMMGQVEHSQEALAMLEYLRLRKFASVVMTQDIRADFPDLRYPPGFHFIAGLLCVPLSTGGQDFIVFFRKGQTREVKWAGNPYEKIIQEGTQNYLEPRTSFQAWNETVVGKCREWSEEQIETAAVLCLVYGKFIEVWRQKEAALQNSRLTKLLLANSAHEVRTPLNAIINYLEIALEGSLDQETRDNLARSHSASKSLIYVINDLLDLTKTEEGQGLIKDEIFDLSACIKEATDSFRKDAERKGLRYEVIEHEGLPKFVYGDQRRVRQSVANVTANAIEHTSEGSVRVESYTTWTEGNKVRIEIVVEDTGRGMSNAKLDALFRDLEQVSSDVDEDVFDRESEKPADGPKVLGLGLAVVARIVRNMDGQLRLNSGDGKGSRFVIQLPFDMPQSNTPDSGITAEIGEASAAASSIASVPPTVPPTREGEVLLVQRTSSNNAPKQTVTPRTSLEGLDSAASLHSATTSRGSVKSSKSDAERLIDAIQTPLIIGEPEPPETVVQRQSSTGPISHRSVSKSLSSRSMSPNRLNTSFHRPAPLTRSASTPGAHDQEVQVAATPGVEYITDTKTPIRPVKVPDEYHDQPERPAQPSETSGVVLDLGDEPQPGSRSRATTTDGHVHQAPKPNSAKLQVLIAEDDPINAKVLRKRLEKAGHVVSHAVNGEECALSYKDSAGKYDVILMDIQMPFLRGDECTVKIRAMEKTGEHGQLSAVAANHGRIPIIAVSATLVEQDKDEYIRAGFDGWILKPIDFQRLERLLFGIIDDQTRNEDTYEPGRWLRGGWFMRRLQLPPDAKAKEAPALRDVELQGSEVSAAKEAAG